jgi:hypothetical protein
MQLAEQLYNLAISTVDFKSFTYNATISLSGKHNFLIPSPPITIRDSLKLAGHLGKCLFGSEPIQQTVIVLIAFKYIASLDIGYEYNSLKSSSDKPVYGVGVFVKA